MKSLVSPPSIRLLDSPEERKFIRNATFEATFQPQAGGRMIRLVHVDHGDLIVPLQDASFDTAEWPKAGAFPMFPFHNRLKNAAFRYGGQTLHLLPKPAYGADGMHGPAHLRPWKATDQGADFLEMSVDYLADDDWPFDFTASQRFELHGDHVSLNLRLRNTGALPQPCGMGWHPYFKAMQKETLVMDACFQWAPCPVDGVPKKNSHETAGDHLEPPFDVAVHYSGWTQASATIGDGARITFSGNSGLPHLSILRKSDYFCLEPTSHVAGALAMLPDTSAETGLRMLGPGETLAASLRLHVAPKRADGGSR